MDGVACVDLPFESRVCLALMTLARGCRVVHTAAGAIRVEVLVLCVDSEDGWDWAVIFLLVLWRRLLLP